MREYLLYYWAPDKPNAYLVGTDAGKGFTRDWKLAYHFDLISAAQIILTLPNDTALFGAELRIQDLPPPRIRTKKNAKSSGS